MNGKWLFTRRTLRSKLVVASIICILVPMLIMLPASEWLTKDKLRKNAENNALQSLEIANKSVSTILNNMLYVVNFIQFDVKMISLLRDELLSPVEIETYDQYSKHMQLLRTLETLSLSGEQLFISILLPNGKSFTNYASRSFEPQQLINESWFVDVKEQLPYDGGWIGVHENYIKDQSSSSHFITVVRPMRLTTKSEYAYIFVSVDEKRLNTVWGDQTNNQEMMLTDLDGVILSHLDSTKIGQSTAHFFDESDGAGDTTKVMAAGAVGQAGAEDAFSSKLIKLQDETYLMAWKKASFYNWNLISLTPYEQAIGEIAGISRSILWTLLLFFSLFLLLLIILIRQFTKPMVELLGVVKQINGGNMDIRSQVRGVDEVGILGKALDNMLDRISEMIQKITLEQQLKRKAEIDMLQAQINPHFLFNILNSVRMGILMKGDKENAGILESLSTLLRMTIERNNAFVPLHEEVDIVRHYLQLMNFRRRRPIDLQVELEPEAMLQEIPRFIIQPIIENACMHGIKQKQGCISIKARFEGTALIIEIADDGAGMEPDIADEINRKVRGALIAANDQDGNKLNGIGLTNVGERIRIIYGPASGMHIESKAGEGTTITLTLDIKSAGGNTYA